METLVWVPVKTLMNQSMFLCVYVSIPSVMLLVLLLGACNKVYNFGEPKMVILRHDMECICDLD